MLSCCDIDEPTKWTGHSRPQATEKNMRGVDPDDEMDEDGEIDDEELP